MAAGLDFLADDTVFLDARERHVLAFPDQLDVSDCTVSMVGALAPLRSRGKPAGRPKHSVRVSELFATRTVRDCDAVALVFACVANRGASTLAPVNVDTALRELVRTSSYRRARIPGTPRRTRSPRTGRACIPLGRGYRLTEAVARLFDVLDLVGAGVPGGVNRDRGAPYTTAAAT